MKKTLVALAVLATAGSAFAQNSISLTGNFGAGVQRSIGGANAGAAYQRAGIAVTDGSLTFAGAEDLGSGLKAGFSLSADFFRPANLGAIAAFNGSSGVATTDSYLTLGGGFGTVKAGLWESRSAAWDGGNVAPISLPIDLYDSASVDGTRSALIQSASRDARVAYSSPSFSGFKVGLTVSERAYGVVAAPSGPYPAEEGVSLSGSYAAGGLSVLLALKNLNLDNGNAYQLGASYDFGVMKVGAGLDLQQRKSAAGAELDDRLGYLVSLAAPIGPVTVGATYIQSDLPEDPATAGLGVEYAISKRTALNASVGKFLSGPATWEDANQSQYRLKLIHSF